MIEISAVLCCVCLVLNCIPEHASPIVSSEEFCILRAAFWVLRAQKLRHKSDLITSQMVRRHSPRYSWDAADELCTESD